jgi:hypothetical protein
MILPRGLTFIPDGELFQTRARLYTGHFKAGGIKGLKGLLESKGFRSFKLFCEAKQASKKPVDGALAAKEMLVTVMIQDFVGEVNRDPEELEHLYAFFDRMSG